MKFIVDAQLPKSLSDFFILKGFNSVHTIELPRKNATDDNEVIEIADNEGRIIVTKDQDFLESLVIKDTPQKLLLITTGNIDNKDLLRIFELNFETLCDLLDQNQIVEINRERITIHY